MIKRDASLLFLFSALATACFVVAWAIVVLPYLMVMWPFAFLPDVGVAVIVSVYGTAPFFVSV